MMQHLTTDTLIDYIHGELSPGDDASVYSHLESCASCRTEYEVEANIGERLRADARASERELPAAVKAEIWERVRSASPSWQTRLAGLLRPAIAIPAAAVLAAAAYFGTTYLGPQGAPSIDAAYYLQDHAAMNGTIPFNDRNTINPVELQTAALDQATAIDVQPSTYTADAAQ